MANSVVPASPAPGARLLLVDGHAYAYRAFFAIKKLASPTGSPTNAIYGFIKMLEKVLALAQPTHVLVVWDGGLAAERLALLPDYKAQRDPMPEALKSQLDSIVHYVEAVGFVNYCQTGVEADDWIAHATVIGRARNAFVAIASSDKDFMQLVADSVALINPNDKELRLWTAAEVEQKTGVQPHQIVDWLCLVGDSVDNIPGVPSVGLKTATTLLRQFGSLDALFSRLGEVSSERLRQTLIDHRERLELNRKLILLKSEFQPAGDWGKWGIQPPDVDRLNQFYDAWGFRSRPWVKSDQPSERQGELF
jgi:DNA polymerase-1